MKILIACECSQTLTEAFRKKGHEAYSCDLQPSYGNYPQYHFIADAIEILYSQKWDLVIAHPPCTFLTKARANRTFRSSKEFLKALPNIHAAHDFFMKFYDYKLCPRAIENPIPLTIASLPPYTQIVNPTQFGDQFSKRTCLWLHELPPLLPTHAEPAISEGFVYHVQHSGKARSKLSKYLAEAIVQQWTQDYNL